MADDSVKQILDVDPESGLPQTKENFWQANRRRFFFIGLILLIALGGAALGAALVFTGVLPALGAGVAAIGIGAAIGAVAFVAVAALFYGAYQLISYFFTEKPPALDIEQAVRLLDTDDPDFSDDREHGHSSEQGHSFASEPSPRTPDPSLSSSRLSMDRSKVGSADAHSPDPSVGEEHNLAHDHSDEVDRTLLRTPSPSSSLGSDESMASDGELESLIKSGDRSSSPDMTSSGSGSDGSMEISSDDDRAGDSFVALSEPSSPRSSSSSSSSSSSASPYSSDEESPREKRSFTLFEKRRPPLVRSYPQPLMLVDIDSEERQRLQRSFRVFATEACSEQIINTITGHNAHVFRQHKIEALTPISPVNTSRELFDHIERRMQILEQLKHPRPWSYSRLDPSRQGEKVIIKIEHNEDLEINSAVIREKKRYSLATRKLSIIGGVLSLLDAPEFLTADDDKKEEIRTYLTNLANEVMHDMHKGRGLKDINEAMNSFVATLNEDIAKIAGIKDEDAIRQEIIGPIREAERYFVAEHNKNLVLTVVTHRRDGSKIIQIDDSLNHTLSDEQKIEYMKIHGDNKPMWFAKLHPAEQRWYQDRIPETLQDRPKWADFEQLFKSSAMQHTPGLANARVNYLITQSASNSFEIESSSMKTGTPVTYEMQAEDRRQQTRLNTLQEIEKLQKIADHNFDNLWGSFFDDHEDATRPRRLILIQSLLSDRTTSMLGKYDKADEDLIVAQREAFNDVASGIDGNYQILYHNNPTNAFRHFQNSDAERQSRRELESLQKMAVTFMTTVFQHSRRAPLTGLEKAALDLLLETSVVLSAKQMKTLTGLINKLDLTEPQKLSMKVLANTENQLRMLGSAKTFSLTDRRNQQEYIIALKKMYVEAMGGATKNNCKSGKDRTGQSEIYQHALWLETKKHDGAVVAYDDSGSKRRVFCQTAALLNCSMKIQEAAALNTSGSVGTKAGPISGIFDTQIADEMGDLYPANCDLAGLNKCKEHQNDEARKVRAIKEEDAGYGQEFEQMVLSGS